MNATEESIDARRRAIRMLVGVTAFAAIFVALIIIVLRAPRALNAALIGLVVLVWIIVLISSIRSMIRGGRWYWRVDESTFTLVTPGKQPQTIALTDIVELRQDKNRIGAKQVSSYFHIVLADGTEVFVNDTIFDYRKMFRAIERAAPHVKRNYDLAGFGFIQPQEPRDQE